MGITSLLQLVYRPVELLPHDKLTPPTKTGTVEITDDDGTEDDVHQAFYAAGYTIPAKAATGCTVHGGNQA